MPQGGTGQDVSGPRGTGNIAQSLRAPYPMRRKKKRRRPLHAAVDRALKGSR